MGDQPVRNERGQFISSGNPSGRPRDNGAAAAIRAAVAQRLTPAEISAIVDRLVVDARRGDAKAREHLFALVGIDLKQINVNQQGGVTITVRYERANTNAT